MSNYPNIILVEISENARTHALLGSTYPSKSLEQLEPYELTALHTAKDLMHRLYWSYSVTFGLFKSEEVKGAVKFDSEVRIRD